MTVPIIQSAVTEISVFSPEHTSHALAWDVTPTPGNTLVAILSRDDDTIGGTGIVNDPAGWTQRVDEQTATGSARTIRVITKVAAVGEPAVTFTFDSTRRSILQIIEIGGSFSGVASGTSSGSTLGLSTGSPGAGLDALILAIMLAGNAQGITSQPSGWTVLDEIVANDGASERLSTWYQQPSPTSGTYGGTVVYAGSVFLCRATLWFVRTIPVAAWSADPVSGNAPLAVQFTDESANGPTSWAWDFGDGATSTSQHPAHTYTTTGSFTVSLTATNADGSDTLTRTSYINVTVDVGYEPPEAATALLEIYASPAGSSRWGTALWGPVTPPAGAWSSAGWVDVTPQGIDARIRWGSSRPELGILGRPEAETWAIRLHDPDRLLDPANAATPYAADLVPGLPIRLSHRGVIIRTGHAESIGHAMARHEGLIRATGSQARLANAAVPADSDLADTLRARARDAIAAAGLSITVEPDPPAGDPAVAPRLEGDLSAWRHIVDAAEQVLSIPYIDRNGRLGFRYWSVPLSRGRALASPELVDLLSIAADAGLYSVVKALETVADGGLVVERALTPTPRYGKRTMERTDPTIDADGWAEAVLADRALPGIRWVPGDVRPLDAASVEQLATIEAVEIVSLDMTEASPTIAASAIVVGGEIVVRSKREDAATWSFRFEAAQAPALPLYVDGASPPEFLLGETGDHYLYPG